MLNVGDKANVEHDLVHDLAEAEGTGKRSWPAKKYDIPVAGQLVEIRGKVPDTKKHIHYGKYVEDAQNIRPVPIKSAHVEEAKSNYSCKRENANDLYCDAESPNCKSILCHDQSLYLRETETFDQCAVSICFHDTNVA